MSSKVFISGDGIQGVVEFEKAKDAKDFYFKVCSENVYAVLYHDDKPYVQKETLKLTD